MNPEVVLGAAKPLIPLIATAISRWGFGTDVQDTVIVGAVFSAAMAIWAGLNNTQNAKIASVNSNDNGVHVVAENVAPTSTVSAAQK